MISIESAFRLHFRGVSVPVNDTYERRFKRAWTSFDL